MKHEERQYPHPRRTHRVQIAIPVLVRGKSGNLPFEEATQTITVNAQGCMLHLSTRVVLNQQLSLVNPKTAEELPSSVVSLGKHEAGKAHVGVAFSEPSPLFWRISFPPDQWESSSERKRPESTSSPIEAKPLLRKKS
jgi:hypothetical protein